MALFFKNPKIQLILKLLFAGLITFLLFKYNKIDMSKIIDILSDTKTLLVLFLLIGLAFVFNSFRWMKVLYMQKVSSRLLTVLNFSIIGLFFNFLLPGSVGGGCC